MSKKSKTQRPSRLHPLAPPADLSPFSQAIWKAIVKPTGWPIQRLVLLAVALEALDQYDTATRHDWPEEMIIALRGQVLSAWQTLWPQRTPAPMLARKATAR